MDRCDRIEHSDYIHHGLSGVPMPAPESFMPSLWPFLFYGAFYFAGWMLRGREQFIDLNVRAAFFLTALMLLAFGGDYWAMPVLDLRILIGGRFEQSALKYWLGIILTCYLSIGLSWLSLIYGKRFLNKRSSFMSLVSDSAYWVYLVHLPLAVFLQTLLVPLDWSVWLKLGVATMGTIVPCLLSYVIFVRYTPLGGGCTEKEIFHNRSILFRGEKSQYCATALEWY